MADPGEHPKVVTVLKSAALRFLTKQAQGVHPLQEET
jgi:hypothetical protein